MIYLLEDDESIRKFVLYALNNTGLEAVGFELAAEFWDAVEKEQPELVLLDIMLPDEDGLSVLRQLRMRSATARVPVILLTAKSTEYDKVVGLDSGADDYVTKPFSPAELTARIDAIFRRIGGDTVVNQELLLQGPFVMNTRNHTLEKNGNRIRLTQVEYSILKLFMQNPGRALSREDILSAVWGRDYEGELKIVDVNIRRLRIKIEDDTANPTYITTVWGFGYKWGI